jgi:hypothetical protein
MEQGDATTRAGEMASAIAVVYQNAGYSLDDNRREQFHGAAFWHAFEFIPDTALTTVVSITEDDGLPILVAIDGQKFYKLAFAEFEWRSDDVPITICEMTQIDPANGYVRAVSQYDPTSAPKALNRTTSWTFGIDGRFTLAFNTGVSPRRGVDPAETFARALARALGWQFSEGD